MPDASAGAEGLDAIGLLHDAGTRSVRGDSRGEPPEFDHERQPDAVRRAVEQHGLDYPHLLDNDHAYWRALGNEYWPTTYLVDRCGRLRYRHIGEVHAGEPSGRALAERIEALLSEPSDCWRIGTTTLVR